ncbi:MAG: hypothetical protein WCF33_03820 [Pseudonocardiaceae bacterium]
MPRITLDLTLEETNLVLEALGALPYVRVYQLVDSIIAQAHQQIERPATDAGAGTADEPPRPAGTARAGVVRSA